LQEATLLKLLQLFKMKKGILITLPRHDDVTEYLSQFSQQIVDVMPVL